MVDFFPLSPPSMLASILSESGWSHVVVIDYTYDSLNRLRQAAYSYGRQFDYSYDAVGNTITQTVDLGPGDPVVTTYQYDTANRLTYVNAQAYTWDNNGNLLNDGAGTYTYDHANHLASANISGIPYTTFRYNGLGDRLSKNVDMSVQEYTLDLAEGLTQVLSDGTKTYLYGNGRIGEKQAAVWQYHLTDGLGSVRQLADNTGAVTLAKGYEPYGEVLESAGSASTAYGYTGEWTDNTGLVYLRARYYDPTVGRFTTRDSWGGDTNQPMSYNGWLYGYANPVIFTDPSGRVPDCDRYQRADLTQWLVDEMNENRRGYIFSIIWFANHFPQFNNFLIPGLPEFDLPYDLASYGVAFGLFADVVKPQGVWDFKNKIHEFVGKNIQLTGNWYRYDVPGNLYFGFIGLAVGFDERILHCGADFATNGIPCSGSDSIEDYEAIEAGYEIYTQAGWGEVDKNMIQIALIKHPLVAIGQKTEPYTKSFSIPWPYPVGTFDDGRSGWIIKHR